MKLILGAFSFRGRTNRQPYWLTSLAVFCAIFAAASVTIIPLIGPVIALVVLVGAVVASLATAARRIHDRGRSAWWLLAMYVPMLLLSGLGAVARMSEPEAGAFFSLLSLPFSIWIFVDLGCLSGTVGPNRFGPDPLEPGGVAEVFS